MKRKDDPPIPNGEAQVQSPLVTRRVLLSALSLPVLAALAAACRPETKRPLGNPVIKEIPKEKETPWSEEQIIALAESMRAQTDYRDIAYAGNLLLNNQQGVASFSKESPLFHDQPLAVASVKGLDTQGRDNELNTVGMDFSREGPVQVNLKPKSNIPFVSTTVDTYQNLKFTQIAINEDKLEGSSPFLLDFLVASIIFSGKALDLSARSLIGKYFQDYQLPTDPKQYNALLISSLESPINTDGVKNYSGYNLAQMWANLHLIPTYQLATDRGRFTPKDQLLLPTYKDASDKLKSKGVLVKNSDGTYGWIQDQQKFIDGWFTTAIEIAKVRPEHK